MTSKFVILNSSFYSDHKNYKEFLVKESRPYIMFLICYEGRDFAIPFRSYLKHNNCFITIDRKETGERKGIDFTKSIILHNNQYIHTSENIKISDEEYLAIKGKNQDIKDQFILYISKYKRLIDSISVKILNNQIKDHDIKNFKYLCNFSTLQYFHLELNIIHDFTNIKDNLGLT